MRRPTNPFGGLPREVGVLVLVSFLVALGFGILAPTIPVFAREFGVSLTAAAAVISIFGVARLIGALPGGRLVEHFGERRVLSTGVWIVAVSSALAGLSQSYGQLLALRGIGGLGSAMFTVSALSLLLRVAPPDKRARAASAFQGGFLLGGILGPGIGGLISAVSIRAPFFFYAFTLVLGGIAAHVMLRSSAAASRDRATRGTNSGDDVPKGWSALRGALRSRPFVIALFLNFATGFTAFGLRASLIPNFVIEDLRRTATLTGIGITLSALVTAALLLPAGRLSDHRGRRPALIIGTSCTALAMGLLVIADGPVMFLIAVMTLGAGGAFMGSTPAAVVGDVTGNKGGTVAGAFQMASDAGTISGPIIAGLIADGVGFGPAFATGGVVSLIGLLLSIAMPETLRRSSSTEADAAPAADDITIAEAAHMEVPDAPTRPPSASA
jgi:MFS family permease